MSTQLSQQQARPSALRTMASRLNVEAESLLSTLKATVCKGCTDPEVMAFSIVANEYNLNPFIKHIYAFPAKGGGIVPVVSVDGWITMTNNHPQMDGIEFEDNHDEKGNLISIACNIWRKDRNRSIRITEYLDECKRPTDPWKMPHRMLRHKALIQCARVAFGFSGVIDEDEADDIARNGGMRETTGRVVDDTDVNPWQDQAPADAKEPAAKKTRATKPKAEEPAPDATEPPVQEEAAPARPTRPEMVKAIREAIKVREMSITTAQARYRTAGLLGQGKELSDLDDEGLYQVSLVAAEALEEGYIPIKEGDDAQ